MKLSEMKLSEYEQKMLQLYWNTLNEDQTLNIFNNPNLITLSFINHLKVKQLQLFQCKNVIPVLNSDLKELEIEQCDLQTIPGFKLNELEVLKAKNNNIITINGSQFPKLKELDLSYNKNFSFTELQFMNQIQKLTLRECNIYDTNVLHYLDNLTELDLSQNKLYNIQVLQYLTFLTKLRLSRCRILNLECLTHLFFLTELDISFNKSVDDITPLSKLSKLTKINMAWCGLKHIYALRNLTCVKELNISGNSEIDITPIQYLKQLVEIKASNCGILDLSVFQVLVHLEHVDVSQNQILSIEPFQPLKNLIYLNLDSNYISSNYFDSLKDQLYNCSFFNYSQKQATRKQINNIIMFQKINRPPTLFRKLYYSRNILTEQLSFGKNTVSSLLQQQDNSQITFSNKIVSLFELLNNQEVCQ
ncbi:leucine-rich_repeat domain-containing protein [Hexamita inflata]|uniref:Leucine-rich repeat domain-containing protein n=1 Tax=Hexamita inflata TaxID=28002 RepID=A0AA86PCW0_9EUKA|nr:leucine-rich repeat domain-containing protein [Hexamita inflata]